MSGEEGSTSLPDVSQTGIGQSAWLIWRMITASAEYKNGKVRRLDGRPGHEWTGSVNKIVNATWPALNDRYIVPDKEDADVIRRTLHAYLRNSRNLVCVNNRGARELSTWWVSDNWSPVTISYIESLAERRPDIVEDSFANEPDQAMSDPQSSTSDVFDLGVTGSTEPEIEGPSQALTEPTEEEAMTTPQGQDPDEPQYLCRADGCERKFHGAHHRSIHENSHGIRVNQDGSVTTFDPAPGGWTHTDGEINQALFDVLKDVTEPLNVAEMVELGQKAHPQMSRNKLKDGVDRLITKPWRGHQLVKQVLPTGQGKGRPNRYLLQRATPKPSDVMATAPKKTGVSVAEWATAKLEEQAAEKVEIITDGASVDMTTHVANLEQLLVDLRRLESQEAKIKELETSLQTTITKRQELKRRLDEVTAERDELKNKLDALKSVFGNAFGN